jgi:glycosyltransferase involved in cell wall biosynthesis
MRILLCAPLYPPEIGGPATYAKILAIELPKHQVETIVLPFRMVKSLPRFFRHLAYFSLCVQKGWRADVFYALDPVSVGWPAFWAAKLLGKRFIVKVVGDYAWEMEMQTKKRKAAKATGQFLTIDDFQNGRFGLLTEVRRWLERFIARRAEVVIVPSNFLKKIVLLWGTPADRIAVIRNAFELSGEAPGRESARRALGFTAEEKIILSAGRLVPWKGFSVLIESFTSVVEQFPASSLLIAGDGPELFRLKRLTRKKKMEEKVKFLGRLDVAVFHQYVAAADVFVLNSGYEGFSHVLLEVMAIGTPIITTPIGGNSEIIRDNQNGLLVEYNNKSAIAKALVQLIANPAIAAALARSAKETVESFSKQRMVSETMAEIRGGKNFFYNQ